MYNAYQVIACGLLSAFVSSLVTTLLWRRAYDKLGDAWAQDRLKLDDRIEELEAELGDVAQVSGDPLESEELVNAIRAFVDNPQGYTVEKWENPDGLSVIVRPKNKEAQP